MIFSSKHTEINISTVSKNKCTRTRTWIRLQVRSSLIERNFCPLFYSRSGLRPCSSTLSANALKLSGGYRPLQRNFFPPLLFLFLSSAQGLGQGLRCQGSRAPGYFQCIRRPSQDLPDCGCRGQVHHSRRAFFPRCLVLALLLLVRRGACPSAIHLFLRATIYDEKFQHVFKQMIYRQFMTEFAEGELWDRTPS